MKVETKYNVGDRVIALSSEGKALEFEVEGISVIVNADIMTIYYRKEGDLYTNFQEEKCFSTEQELMEYVMSGISRQ